MTLWQKDYVRPHGIPLKKPKSILTVSMLTNIQECYVNKAISTVYFPCSSPIKIILSTMCPLTLDFDSGIMPVITQAVDLS